MLEIRLFGKFELRKNGEILDLPSRKSQALLSYLLLNPNVQHRRERIAGLLWPDSEESKARSQLRYALWQIRNAIGDQYIQADKISLSLNPGDEFWIDTAVIDLKNS